MDDIRRGRYWLLLSQLAAVLPHGQMLPAWLSLTLLLACLWRLPTVEIRVPPPGFWVRLLVLLAGVFGIWKSFNTVVGPEAGTAFLILCMALKILEMQSRRDCYVVVILGFFVVATNFLFGQSLWLALYIGLVLLLIVMALVALNQPRHSSSRQTLRKALVLLGQALPLMLILFVFFPRLPPLWSLNLTQASGRTGMSDSMSPGDIAQLSQSTERAFRVEFEGAPPPKSQMYWRGLVLSNFDGTRWTQAPEFAEGSGSYWPGMPVPNWLRSIGFNRASAVNYQVILEPTDKPWLFALGLPRTADKDIALGREITLQKTTPVFSRFTYSVQSYTQRQVDVQLSAWMRSHYLRLPEGSNQRSRAQAQNWRLEQGDDRAYMQQVLRWFNRNNFYYTLEPPALGGQRIDEFLFESRQGFCEHYASSFVFLMRAAGIPARVVVGYLGGEESPYGDYWQVRQMDAHAWAEVWLPGEGWIEIDPTAAVAPERIRQGVESLAAQREFWGASGFSGLRYSNYHLFRGLRQWADYANYVWYSDVLGYDSDKQSGFMQRLLGRDDLLQRTLIMAGLFAGVLGAMAIWMLWQRPRRHEVVEDRIYRRYCQRMARAGLPRQRGEGARDYAERIAKNRPKLAKGAREVAQLYIQLQYRQPRGRAEPLLRRFRRLARTVPVRA